jgi:phosphoribosylpyrophosphate synthetase
MESIRGKDIYIIQDVENRYPVNFTDGDVRESLSVNDHLMTIFVTIDMAKRAETGHITLVLPCYPYSCVSTRQREGLTASRVGRIWKILTWIVSSPGYSFMRHRQFLWQAQAGKPSRKLSDYTLSLK